MKGKGKKNGTNKSETNQDVKERPQAGRGNWKGRFPAWVGGKLTEGPNPGKGEK